MGDVPSSLLSFGSKWGEFGTAKGVFYLLGMVIWMAVGRYWLENDVSGDLWRSRPNIMANVYFEGKK